MLQRLEIKEIEGQKLAEAVISTLAFFSLYNLPLSSKRVHELLLGLKASQSEVESMLAVLVKRGLVFQEVNLFALKKWNASEYSSNQLELTKKWAKIDYYYNWLAALPFIKNISIINSLALGTADSDSDIDFFVITKPNRLYFVRSLVIVLFKLLGVYKTRQKIKDRFCFGFYVSAEKQNLHELLLKPEDPYFVFWLSNMRPLTGEAEYRQFMQDNSWIRTYFPNFDPEQRLATVKKPGAAVRLVKLILEIGLFIPSLLIEPIARRVHIGHTLKLAENHSVYSTTIANKDMLKLHGHDVRAEVAEAYNRILNA